MENKSSTENEIINIIFDGIDLYRIKKIFTHSLASTLLSNCNEFFTDKSLSKSGELTQSEIIYIISVTFTNKIVFEHFLKLLPADLLTVFNILIKEPIISKSQLLTQYNINVFQNFGNGNYYALKDEYYLFINKRDTKSYYLSKEEEIIFNIPIKLKKQLLILASKNLDLQQYDHLPTEANTLFVFQNGEDLFDIIADIYKMLSLDKIIFTQKNELSKKSEQIIKSGFNIREFYQINDDKSLLSNLRIRTIFEYIASFPLEIKGEKLEIYRQLFWERIKTKTYFCSEIHLLLKHISYFSPTTSQIEENFLIFLKSFTVDKWISFREIINHILIADIKVFISGGYPIFNGKNRKVDLYCYSRDSDLKYNILINIPLLKGIFFRFAAFGLMDIAYTIPESIPIFQSKNSNYTSIYDGLEYIKLTQLGVYALGLTDNIELKANINKRPLFRFNQYAMILTLDGRDPYLETLLLDYGNLISAGKYHITYEKLAKECNTKVDLQNKINTFKKEITEQIPPNWEDFFQKAIRNFDCITNLDTYSIYGIDQSNIELLNLFTHDRTLQNLVVKAENYKFLVLKKNEQKLKNYLCSKGYCFSLKD